MSTKLADILKRFKMFCVCFFVLLTCSFIYDYSKMVTVSKMIICANLLNVEYIIRAIRAEFALSKRLTQNRPKHLFITALSF